jgi:carbon monoxide dehydrogenase subunit G
MELKDEIKLPAKLDYVYDCLNNLEVLKICIPGCVELLENEDGSLSAKVVLKIGPIKAKFNGKVVLDLSGAPNKYALSGEGDGGVAGFAKGGADVELLEDGDETILKYNAKSEVKGKIAQLGSRLILSTAKNYLKHFLKILENISLNRRS